MTWNPTFTSVAALRKAYAEMGVDGRCVVNTYGELKGFAQLPTDTPQSPEELDALLLLHLHRVNAALEESQLSLPGPGPGGERTESDMLERLLVEVEWLTPTEISSDPFSSGRVRARMSGRRPVGG